MDKKINSFKLGFVLLIITALTGLILGTIYTVTKGPIQAQMIKTNNDAMKEIITKADTFEKINTKLKGNVTEVNAAKKGSETIGYTIKLTSKGYGGNIEIMVGISAKDEIEGIKILSQSETPGLGANSENPSFYGQYKSKSIKKDLNVVKTKPSNENEIQAITGATITSKAVTHGVNEAVQYYKDNLKGGNN
ncbi:RnfABCDGE type electron transport complex subunit G [Haloimpatiens sp. FM7315]|uniref:RnfABCDGE type electron transport complex subunit G n=1 Tax=Haloimpatiens sp. FM7315 TaxID=3298609 RepID=UPI0035A2B4F7